MPFNIFVGFDDRQIRSYTVLQNSLIRHASEPIAITPLILPTLPIKRRGLTPFTYSRFLCPWLCGYAGWSLFLDSDMLAMDDPCAILKQADPTCDVMVVKNGLRFEWSSVMLFNNDRCRVLTPEYVDKGPSPLPLEWASSIGELPARWNHLVGYDAPGDNPALVHFTQGVPAFPETALCDYADQWRQELGSALALTSWEELMGGSVHAQHVRERLKRTA